MQRKPSFVTLAAVWDECIQKGKMEYKNNYIHIAMHVELSLGPADNFKHIISLQKRSVYC